ncbi:ataxin-10 isoform X2 [Ischnura elegans]|uniref:ataxin-10 isoform X2 n=1 Tax=Ischnura elegans TaxID=197161 RepID=UPI001ED86E9E|nr:ataxin-10 isoform X2 [Ischnura elegans]
MKKIGRNSTQPFLFIVELLLKSKGFLTKYYSELSPEQKYYILDVISSNVSAISNDDTTKESRKVHLSSIQFISHQFCASSDSILNIRSFCKVEANQASENLSQDISDDGDPCEVSKWLDVLSSASGNEEYLSSLQDDGELLIQAVFLLKSILLVGKLAEDEGDLQHPFVPMQKLSAVGLIQPECDIEGHPVHGFKRNLVRLIGNMAWKNKTVQNKVLELECVPLILDCCNIDERNPFITQWAIMAIHNLCDGNVEVQEVIWSLKREGVINPDFLKEMGLRLHDSGSEKISIIPLPK